MAAVTLFALAAAAAAAAVLAPAAADTHTQCACEARAHGWAIDCVDTAPVAEAVAFLQAPANNCTCGEHGHSHSHGDEDEDGPDGRDGHSEADDGHAHSSEYSEECEEAYHIFQAHHDHCAHDGIIAWGALHDFEACYEDCHIQRQFDPDLGQCPEVDCDNEAALTGAASLLTTDFCGSNGCAGEACAAAFQLILAAHDTCDEDTLPTEVEQAFHDFLDPCGANLCNAVDAATDPDDAECGEDGHGEDGHGHGEDGHGHGHGDGDGEHEPMACHCAAVMGGWAIDCSNATAIDAASAYLEANCADTHSDPCHDALLVLQAHHDHCPHDTLARSQEVTLHEMADFHASVWCYVRRQHDASLPQCEAVDCADAAALEAASTLLVGDCASSCASDDCAAAFRAVLMAHDTCDQDTLPTDVEIAMHVAEDACAAALCNTVDAPFDVADVECASEEDGHEDGEDGNDTNGQEDGEEDGEDGNDTNGQEDGEEDGEDGNDTNGQEDGEEDGEDEGAPPPPPPTSGAAARGASLAAAAAVAAAVLA